MAFTFPRLAELLLSLIEKFLACALVLVGGARYLPQEASVQPYKGTRPAQPRAIAVVWAEAAVDEGAAKQISDILKWCAQEDLEDFCIYDPAGELKAHAEELQRSLQCRVEVGWSQDPVAAKLLCGTCGEQAHPSETLVQNAALHPVKGAVLAAEAAGSDTAGHASVKLHPCASHSHMPGAGPDGESSAKQVVYVLHGIAGNSTPGAGLVGPSMCSEEMCKCGGLRGSGAKSEETSRSGAAKAPGVHDDSGGASGRFDAPNGAVCLPGVNGAGSAGPPQPSGAPGGLHWEAQGPSGHLDHAPQPSDSGATSSPSATGLHGASLPEQTSTSKVRVRVLSASDAYSPVLEVARSGGRCAGCGEVLPLQGGPYREGLARLRGQLRQLAGDAVLIQPELVLVVGPALTLAGYPPLQVAASEILHVGPAAQLCRSKVDGALAKYFRTEQRFGS